MILVQRLQLPYGALKLKPCRGLQPRLAAVILRGVQMIHRIFSGGNL
jgi:hypothetical protein